MHQDILKIIKCPYCGTDFEIKEIYGEDKEITKEITNGSIRCECNEYPILEGILILKNTYVKEYIMNYLKNKEIEKAVAILFGNCSNDIYRIAGAIESKPFGKFFKKSFIDIANNSFKEKYKIYSNKDLSFYDVLGNSRYEMYLKHRFSSQTFWSLYPFIKLLRKKRKRILEVCCGTGHASFVISKYVNPDELICVDGDFKNLYLARKYFSNTEFINIDANYQLPFKDHVFTSVFMMDAFHYIDARALLANECERILDREGMLLILHLHNSLVNNVTAGKPVSPSAWKGMFNNLNIIALPEKGIVEDFILRDRLDLSKIYSEEELNSSDAILLIAGTETNCAYGIWKDIMEVKENLIINPIYKIKDGGDKYLLELEFPSDFYRKEYPLTDMYLPRTCIIDKTILKGSLLDANKIEIDNLMRNFVIINAPENYSMRNE